MSLLYHKTIRVLEEGRLIFQLFGLNGLPAQESKLTQ